MSNANEFVAALRRFINLTRLTFTTLGHLDDDLLSDIPRIEKLSALSIGGFHTSVTRSGLIDVVRRLPDLEQVSLVSEFSDNHIELTQSTYLELCDIYRARNQKLVISNFDVSCGRLRMNLRNEPFAGNDQQQNVRYIELNGFDRNAIVDIRMNAI